MTRIDTQGIMLLIVSALWGFGSAWMFVRGLRTGKTRAPRTPIYDVRESPGMFFTMMVLHAIGAVFFLTILAGTIGLMAAGKSAM